MAQEANKVVFGLSKIVLFKITEVDGNITYGAPIKIPGAVNISVDPEGDESPFYADNIKYYISTSNQGYSGDLEVAKIPEEVYTEIFGMTKDSNGALIEGTNDKASKFGMAFQGEGDKKSRRVVYYYCSATRPSKEYATNEDKIEPQTEKMSITMSARPNDGLVKATIEETDENKAIYDTFFDKIYEKNAQVSGGDAGKSTVTKVASK